MISNLRPGFSAFLRPFMRVFAALHVHPNALTISGVVFFGVAGWLTATGHWLIALGVLGVGACLDGLDGLLAKETGQQSVFGAILDSTCDRLTEIAWFAGILWYYLADPSRDSRHLFVAMTFAALTGSLMVSYVKARAEGVGVGCSPGILQRPERLVLICVGLLLGPRVMPWILGAIGVLSYATTVQRLIVAWKGSRRRV